MTDPRYPIGPFVPPSAYSPELRADLIEKIASTPSRLSDAVRDLTDARLETPYRDGGWTVAQVVHHVADSHMNGFIRVKLALTEESPTIKPYDENAWARLADMRLPVRVSLELRDGIHTRWVAVYRAMAEDQFARSFLHPEHGKRMTLDYHLQEYAWHSRHHVAHVTELRRRAGW